MKIYLIRHAAAVERGTPGMMDEDRPLIQKGRDRMVDIGKAFKAEGMPLARLFASPLVRAVQTAELFAWAAGFRGEVEITRALVPSASPQDLEQFLRSIGDCKGIGLVGHEPNMHEFAGHFLARADFPEFKKGALCAIDLPRGPGEAGRLLGLLQPKSLEWERP
jgi:phosphohistidine phosphatase